MRHWHPPRTVPPLRWALSCSRHCSLTTDSYGGVRPLNPMARSGLACLLCHCCAFFICAYLRRCLSSSGRWPRLVLSPSFCQSALGVSLVGHYSTVSTRGRYMHELLRRQLQVRQGTIREGHGKRCQHYLGARDYLGMNATMPRPAQPSHPQSAPAVSMMKLPLAAVLAEKFGYPHCFECPVGTFGRCAFSLFFYL